jgi:hypothetical protein
MQYYLCFYGTRTVRLSRKCATPAEAANYCYGVTRRVTCLPIGGRQFRSLPRSRRVALEEKGRELHAKNLAAWDESLNAPPVPPVTPPPPPPAPPTLQQLFDEFDEATQRYARDVATSKEEEDDKYRERYTQTRAALMQRIGLT